MTNDCVVGIFSSDWNQRPSVTDFADIPCCLIGALPLQVASETTPPFSTPIKYCVPGISEFRNLNVSPEFEFQFPSTA
jgi:hypothetical protein